MRHNYQARLAAMVEGIADWHLGQIKEGHRNYRHRMTYRGTVCMVEIKQIRGRTLVSITNHPQNSLQNMLVTMYTDNHEVKVYQNGSQNKNISPKKVFDLLQKAVFRHYSEHNAEDIMSNMLDNYWRIVE
jgi:hypothetical protein